MVFISALIEALVKHRLKDKEVEDEDDEPGNAGMGEVYIRRPTSASVCWR